MDGFPFCQNLSQSIHFFLYAAVLCACQLREREYEKVNNEMFCGKNGVGS